MKRKKTVAEELKAYVDEQKKKKNPKSMKPFWVVVSPKGYALYYSAAQERKQLMKSIDQSLPYAWKYYYDAGYRCVRVVEDMKK